MTAIYGRNSTPNLQHLNPTANRCSTTFSRAMMIQIWTFCKATECVSSQAARSMLQLG